MIGAVCAGPELNYKEVVVMSEDVKNRCITMSDSMWNRLGAIARHSELYRNRSSLIRLAVLEWLERHESDHESVR